MSESDAFAVFGWGLRRYAWVVAVFVLGLGVLVPAMFASAPDQFDARAQVGPTEPLNLPNLDPLPRLGESVFHNGSVAEGIRQAFTPPLPRSASVIPERVELIAAQDNVVFTVVGHGRTPESARHVANLAAALFTESLNQYSQSVGRFAIQHLASTPSRPVPAVDGPVALAIGLLSGLVAGMGAVALVLVWSRPVIDAAAAEDATGSPVLAHLRLASDIRGLPRLCHRLLTGSTDMVLLASPRRSKHDRHLIATALARTLSQTRKVALRQGGTELAGRTFAGYTMKEASEDHPEFVIVDGPSQTEVIFRPSTALTLLVVPEGIGYASLRRNAENYLDAGATGVLLVRRGPRGQRIRLRERRSTSPRAAQPGPSREQAVVGKSS